MIVVIVYYSRDEIIDVQRGRCIDKRPRPLLLNYAPFHENTPVPRNHAPLATPPLNITVYSRASLFYDFLKIRPRQHHVDNTHVIQGHYQ